MEPPTLRAVFSGALSRLPGEERVAFLEAACGGNAALRAEVEQALREHEGGRTEPDSGLRSVGRFASDEQKAPEDDAIGGERVSAGGSFLSGSDGEGVEEGRHDAGEFPPEERLGTRVGSYLLLERLGKGGLGSVYLAEQERPVRRLVALKIIEAGADSRQTLARFELERQSMAQMDHPNIAKVLDAGTTDSGRPFVVRELVNGVPITPFCDEFKLPVKERLELFVRVCQAVQHAHHKGVVHRDLKPSSVLVSLYDGRHVPKVIDFGLVKAAGPRLSDRTVYIEFGAVASTLEYMSPEQARQNQLDVDTRSDVYSLGVLLYELLTGTPPLERRRLEHTPLLEALRLIREEQPEKPSDRLAGAEGLAAIAGRRGTDGRRLLGQVRGELDLIVMRALEKNRSRRYATADGLAHDVQRFLRHEPVEARGSSRAGTRTRRSRRRGAPLLWSLIVLQLAGLAYAGWHWYAAEVARRDLAQRRLDEQALRQSIDVQRALLDNDPRARQARQLLDARYMRLAGLLRGAGRPADATEVVEERMRMWRGHPAQLYDGACEIAMGLSAGAPASGVGDAERRRIADKAIEWLGYAVLAGFMDWRRLSSDRELEPLRSRADFQAMLEALQDPLPPSREIRMLAAHERSADDLAVSADGRRLASAGRDGAVCLWDVDSVRQPRRLHVGGWVQSVAISRAGDRILTGDSTGSVRLFNADDGQMIRRYEGPHAAVKDVLFSPNERAILAASADNTVSMWDTETGDPMRQFRGHTGSVNGLAISPNGLFLITASDDRTVRLWDVSSGQELHCFEGHRGQVNCVAVVADGTRAFSGGSGGSLILWDLTQGKVIRAFDYPGSEFHCAAISPDGHGALIGDQAGRVIAWDLEKDSVPHLLGSAGELVASAVVLPNGLRAVTAHADGTLRLWSVGEDATRAFESARLGRWEEASAEFGQALRAEPRNAVLHRERAWLAARLGRWDDVVHDFTALVELEPRVAAHRHGLTLALLLADNREGYREACAEALEQAGASDDFDPFPLARAVSLAPITLPQHLFATVPPEASERVIGRVPSLSYITGLAHYRAGDWEKAISRLEGSINAKPPWPATPLCWPVLAMAHQKSGHTDAARDWLAKCYPDDRRQSPGRDFTLPMLAGADRWDRYEFLVLRNEAEEVIAGRASLIAPQHGMSELVSLLEAILHDRTGAALARQGRPGEAETEFRSAIRLRPDFAAAHANLGAALRAQSRSQEAEAEFREAIRERPGLSSARVQLAKTLLEQGRLREAEAEFQVEHDLRVNLNNAEVFFNHGDICAREGRWDEATSAVERSLELDPSDHFKWYCAATLRLRRGDFEGYRRLCRAMLERFGTTDNMLVADRIAKLCLLAQGAVTGTESRSVNALAARVADKSDAHWAHRWFLLVKGLADYREGQFTESLARLKVCAPKRNGEAFDASVFAVESMAETRLGRIEQGRTALLSAKAILVEKLPALDKGGSFGYDWLDWLHSQLLVQEAERISSTAHESQKATK